MSLISGTTIGPKIPLLSGVIGVGSIRLSSMGLKLMSTALLTHMLGAEGYGVYGFAIAVIGILATPIQNGISQFVLRNTAIYLGQGNLFLMKGLHIASTNAVLMITILVAMIGSFVTVIWHPSGGALSTTTLCWALSILPWIGLAAVRTGALRGLGHVVLGSVPGETLRPLFFIFVIISIAVITTKSTPVEALQAQLVATIMTFAVSAALLRRLRPSAYSHVSAKYEFGQWAHSAVPFLIVASTQVILERTDIIVLGVLKSATDVGIYSVCASVSALVIFGLVVVNSAIAPYVVQFYGSRDRRNLQRLVTSASRLGLLVAVVPALGFVTYGGWILERCFGDEFASGRMVLAMLAAGQLVNVAMGPVGLILSMTGHAWYNSLGMGIAALLNVVLDVVLIPRFGILGAAAATVASLVTWNFLLTFWVRKYTGVTASVFVSRPLSSSAGTGK